MKTKVVVVVAVVMVVVAAVADPSYHTITTAIKLIIWEFRVQNTESLTAAAAG